MDGKRGIMTVSGDTDGKRRSIQERVSAWLDLPLSALAILLLGLLIVEFTVDLSAQSLWRVTAIQTAIWAVFFAAFILELSLARSKLSFLRHNWLAAVALLVPMLRVLRLVRIFRFASAARIVRSANLVRVGTALNRAMREVGGYLRESRLAYVLLLTGGLTITASASAYYFERGADGSEMSSVPDALWWSTFTLVELPGSVEIVTVEGRIIAVAVRLLGVALIGYLTATIAARIIGTDRSSIQDIHDEVRLLREDISKMSERNDLPPEN